MVFALAGDSTMTREVVPGSGGGPSSTSSARFRARGFAAFFAAVFFAVVFLAVAILLMNDLVVGRPASVLKA